jgi:hypothetical protein
VRQAIAEDGRIDRLLLLRDLWAGGYPTTTTVQRQTAYDLKLQAAHELVSISSKCWIVDWCLGVYQPTKQDTIGKTWATRTTNACASGDYNLFII